MKMLLFLWERPASSSNDVTQSTYISPLIVGQCCLGIVIFKRTCLRDLEPMILESSFAFNKCNRMLDIEAIFRFN